MRVVLDTNVLLSTLISPHGAPETIYRAWRDGRFTLVTAAMQLDALRRASRYPKLKSILPAHRMGIMVNHLQHAVVLKVLLSLPAGIALNDSDDEFLLAMALDGQADYLVTGDRRAGMLRRGTIGHARILTPVVFCSEILA